MVKNTNQRAVVVDLVVYNTNFSVFVIVVAGERTLRNTFALSGHCIGSVLDNKLVVAFQHALGMFSGEHPAIFRCAVSEAVTVSFVSSAIVNTQLQRTARVDFHLR